MLVWSGCWMIPVTCRCCIITLLVCYHKLQRPHRYKDPHLIPYIIIVPSLLLYMQIKCSSTSCRIEQAIDCWCLHLADYQVSPKPNALGRNHYGPPEVKKRKLGNYFLVTSLSGLVSINCLHSVACISDSNMSLIVLDNCWLCSTSMLIEEDTICWWIAYICPCVHITMFVSQHHCCQVIPWPRANIVVTWFCVIPFLLGLTVLRILVDLFIICYVLTAVTMKRTEQFLLFWHVVTTPKAKTGQWPPSQCSRSKIIFPWTNFQQFKIRDELLSVVCHKMMKWCICSIYSPIETSQYHAWGCRPLCYILPLLDSTWSIHQLNLPT